MLFYACWLALSHSGRHERTTVSTLLLCAEPIEGCSAVLVVRRYHRRFRGLVCAFVVASEEKKSGSKNKKNAWVIVFFEASRADDTASFDSVCL